MPPLENRGSVIYTVGIYLKGRTYMIKFSDSPASDALWKRLSDRTNPDLADAFRELYSIYEVGLVEWFADLYDTRRGGFYYSPSARDNDTVIYKDKEYKLLPDIESTWQALGFIDTSGLGAGYADVYRDYIPLWMQRQMHDFAYNMQDPDGYFYHEQWGKDISVSRRGRDLGSARAVIKVFGGTPKYSSLIDSAPAEKKDESELLIPDHLTSRSKFIDYLDSLDIPNMSYHAGNTLNSQFGQIDRQGLTDTCIEYLSALQHPDTGHWHHETDYYAINGLMKISCFYKNAKVILPNSHTAAMGAIAAITSSEPCNGITQIWNTWYAVRNITSTLKLYGTEGNALADEIVATLHKGAAEAVRVTKDKVLPMSEPGCSFSYGIGHPCIVSQGSPVCIPNLPEGDINGTVMASNLMIDVIFTAMELGDYKIPLYGKEEGRLFLDRIEENRKKHS